MREKEVVGVVRFTYNREGRAAPARTPPAMADKRGVDMHNVTDRAERCKPR